MTDGQTLFNVLIAIVCGGGGWWLNTVWTSVRELQKADRDLVTRLGQIEVLVAGQYVKRDEYQADIRTIFQKLDDIAFAIGKKADR